MGVVVQLLTMSEMTPYFTMTKCNKLFAVSTVPAMEEVGVRY